MKIGVFDSGLGGLVILKGLAAKLPSYDYHYLGDTKRVPYGNRSQETIYEFLKQGVRFLLQNDCALVIVACNTASAAALRKIQQEYLPAEYPDRRVLGVIIPTAEVAVRLTSGRIGVLATQSTVASGAFEREIAKLSPEARVFQSAAPVLVPLIENGMGDFAQPFISRYLEPLKKSKIDTLILGCTHYPILSGQIKSCSGTIKMVAQDRILPPKLKDYLARHPELEKRLSKRSRRILSVTDLTETSSRLARKWFGRSAELELVNLE